MATAASPSSIQVCLLCGASKFYDVSESRGPLVCCQGRLFLFFRGVGSFKGLLELRTPQQRQQMLETWLRQFGLGLQAPRLQNRGILPDTWTKILEIALEADNLFVKGVRAAIVEIDKDDLDARSPSCPIDFFSKPDGADADDNWFESNYDDGM